MNKINLAQKIAALVSSQKRKTSFDRSIMHPEREWFIGVMLLFIILLISVYWNVVHYNHYRNVQLNSTKEAESLIVYKTNLVDAALVDFSKRAEEYEAVKAKLLYGADQSSIILDEVIVEDAPIEEALVPPIDEGSVELPNTETELEIELGI